MRERQFVADLVSSQDLPKMFKVRQTFPRPRIEPEDIPGIIRGCKAALRNHIEDKK